MNITPNNVLITNCTNLPLCFHVAITCMYNGELCVFHCTPSKSNIYGGNVVCERLDQFLKDRKIKSVYYVDVPVIEIVKNFNQVKYKKWDPLNFNCETYINQLISNNKGSTQLERLFCVTLLCGSVFIL